MKKHQGLLLALLPFFVYSALSIPAYILEIFKAFYPQLSSSENILGSIVSGIWLVSVWFFPLSIPTLQYTKGLFKLWFAPLNLLAIICGNIAIGYLSSLFDEMGSWLILWISLIIVFFSAVVNLVYAIIYIVKKRKLKNHALCK